MRSYNGVKSLLASPQAIGEVVYRGHRFPAPALIDRETSRQVQLIEPPGPQPEVGPAARPSRGAALRRLRRPDGGRDGKDHRWPRHAGKGQRGHPVPVYRCGAPRGDSTRGVTIPPTVEQIGVGRVREAIARR